MDAINKLFQKTEIISDFRISANLGLSCVVIVLVTPFAINNLIQGRLTLGAVSTAIVVLSGFNAWSIALGQFRPLLVFVGLAPIMICTLVLAIHELGVVGVLWCYPVTLSFYFILTERHAWLANAILLLIILPLEWFLLDNALAIRVAISLILVSAFSAVFIRVISYQHQTFCKPIISRIHPIYR